MHIASSLPPASPAAVRRVADELFTRAAQQLVVPALRPAIRHTRVLLGTAERRMAEAGLALTAHEERRIREALADAHTAIVHTLARLDQR
jgi:hypothetical protein